VRLTTNSEVTVGEKLVWKTKLIRKERIPEAGMKNRNGAGEGWE
jgi:hypothetical protein